VGGREGGREEKMRIWFLEDEGAIEDAREEHARRT